MGQKSRVELHVRFDHDSDTWDVDLGRRCLRSNTGKEEAMRWGALLGDTLFDTHGVECELIPHNKNGRISKSGRATYGNDPRSTEG